MDNPRDPIVIPKPGGLIAEPWSTTKLWRLAALFGPAAIVASVSIGAGETIVVVQAGSWAGYDLLWLVLASVLVKGICVTYLLGRYTAVSGELIGPRLVRMPGPRGWLLMTIILLELAAAGPLWAAIARPSGDLMYFLLQRFGAMMDLDSGPLVGITAATWKSIFASAFILAAILLGAGISFTLLERQQVIICVILVLGTIIGTLMVRPDFAATLMGLLDVGHVPEIPPWAPADVRRQPLLAMTTIFGYVGGSVMCYIAYANWIAIHRWGLCGHNKIDEIRRRAALGSAGDYLPNDARQAARLNRLLAPLRWDVAMGALVLLIVSASFMLAGAAVLYPRLQSGELPTLFEGWSLLTEQGSIWSNIHPALVWVYYVCVLAALWGTLQSYPEIYTRVTHEFLNAIWGEGKIPYGHLQYAICTYVLLTAVWLSWIDVQFATLTAIVSFLATNAGVAVAMLAALYLNFQLPPLYRTRWWMLAAGIISAVILVVVSAVSGWELAQKIARQ
ncbi:MAG: Nramp family divalent metal transporter [Pirellulales bacterium]